MSIPAHSCSSCIKYLGSPSTAIEICTLYFCTACTTWRVGSAGYRSLDLLAIRAAFIFVSFFFFFISRFKFALIGIRYEIAFEKSKFNTDENMQAYRPYKNPRTNMNVVIFWNSYSAVTVTSYKLEMRVNCVQVWTYILNISLQKLREQEKRVRGGREKYVELYIFYVIKTRRY